jgi:hypothetical protein
MKRQRYSCSRISVTHPSKHSREKKIDWIQYNNVSNEDVSKPASERLGEEQTGGFRVDEEKKRSHAQSRQHPYP